MIYPLAGRAVRLVLESYTVDALSVGTARIDIITQMPTEGCETPGERKWRKQTSFSSPFQFHFSADALTEPTSLSQDAALEQEHARESSYVFNNLRK